MADIKLPKEFEATRAAVSQAIQPICPDNEHTQAEDKFLLTSQRTDAGRELPEYFLVYFMLVDLLGFKNLGKWDKCAWSVLIDFNGKAFLN